MAAIKLAWGYRSLYLLPLLLFLSLSFLSLLRGRSGIWHEKAIELWNGQKWNELQAMAENLYLVGKADSESIYLAMLAASEEGNQDEIRHFAKRLAARKLLNWRTELSLVKLYKPDSFQDMLSLYRTRAATGLTLLLILLLTLSFRSSGKYLFWLAFCSTTGTLLLLL